MKELIVITASKPIIFKWGTLNKYSLVSSVKSIFFLENVRIYHSVFKEQNMALVYNLYIDGIN